MRLAYCVKYYALLLILLGGCVAYGWIFHVPALTQIFSDWTAMVFNSSICFMLLGFYFLVQSKLQKPFQILATCFLFIIFTIATCNLLEGIFNLHIGMTHFFMTPWLQDGNRTPGLMAVNTSVAFILCALIGWLLPFAQNRKIGTTIQCLILVIALITLVSVFLYIIQLEIILSWYSLRRMALTTAIGFMLVSLAWMSLVQQQQWYQDFYQGYEHLKIILLTGIILFSFTLVTALGMISFLSNQSVENLQLEFQDKLNEKILTFQNEMSQIKKEILVVTTRQDFQHDLATHQNLQAFAQQLMGKGVSFVAFTDAEQNFIYQSGLPVIPDAILKLQTSDSASLIWNKILWLKIQSPIVLQNKILGYILVEYPMLAFSQSYFDYHNLGLSGENGICAKVDDKTAQCFPTRLTPKPFTVMLQNPKNKYAIEYAFAQKAGIVNTQDYRKINIIAAFSPLGTTGLAMVTKMDTSEVYEPLHKQLQLIIPVILVLIGFTLIVLHWQISPLVRKVFASEKKAQVAKQRLLNNESMLKSNHLKLEKSLEELKRLNSEILVSKAFLSELQFIFKLTEIFNLIAKFSLSLFPGTAGVLYLTNPLKNHLEAQVEWGISHSKDKLIDPTDCLSLRKGALCTHVSAKDQMQCDHINGRLLKHTAICVPLYAHNESIGLYYIEFSQIINSEALPLLEMRVQTFADQLSLAIANIKLHETLRFQSIRDPLTNLYNRRYLEETLDRELVRAQRKSLSLAVLMFDVDHFKYFNDMYGHEAGDDVLKEVSNVIRDCIRASDVACRYGGEEFVVILLESPMAFAQTHAEKLREKIASMSLNRSRGILSSITVSIGVAMFPKHGQSTQDLLSAADIALYGAKNSGRNKVVIYKPSD